jgi:hypothetical protein
MVRRKTQMKTCEQCGEVFWFAPRCFADIPKRKFCSPKCCGLSQASQETDPARMSKHRRYNLRKQGIPIPKFNPGLKPQDFWSLVVKTESCWIWVGQRNRDGYGQYNNNGCHMAHRWAWSDSGGEPLGDRILMHKCDNPPCVNPDHLFPGTHQDNQQDKINKNRQARGETSGSSRLTAAQVLEMRKRRAEGWQYKQIAVAFGVCKDTAQKAVRGINWSHL